MDRSLWSRARTFLRKLYEIDFVSMTYSFSTYTWLVTRDMPAAVRHVTDSAPHTRTPPFKTPFFSSCPWCQPHCCYRVESRARARGFSLPSVSTRHYRFARAQPSSYFPSCPLYIYIMVSTEIVSRPREFSLDPLIDRPLHWERNDVYWIYWHPG